MSNSKKNKKPIFSIEDLAMLNLAFNDLKKDTKCNEVRIFEDGKLLGVESVKILEKVTTRIKDKYGSYKIKDILEEYFFDYFLKNKKAKLLKHKKIESIDISKNFIRFNLKEDE